MPVIIEYVVERDGMDKMTFTSKTEADAYDKLLDTADNISQLLEDSSILDEQQIQTLSIYLAKNRDDLINALAYKRKAIKPTQEVKETPPTKKNKKSEKNIPPQSLLDIVIEPDEEAISNVVEEVLDQSNSEEAA